MNLYECPECHAMYSKADLIRTKCSENEVGSYIINYCPKCMNKRKPKMVKLLERKSTNTEAILLGHENEDIECINWLEQG